MSDLEKDREMRMKTSARRGEKPDRSIPFCNVILRCDRYGAPAARLPEGFRFASYRPGMERDWARLEAEIGDFDSAAETEAYFAEAYLSRPDELAARGVFVENAAGEVVGSCIAWRDNRRGAPVASLHWLVVGPKWQDRGLGRALAARTALRMIHAEDAVFASWPEEDVAQYLALSERYLTALREQVRQL